MKSAFSDSPDPLAFCQHLQWFGLYSSVFADALSCVRASSPMAEPQHTPLAETASTSSLSDLICVFSHQL